MAAIADRFLREVKRMRQLRREINEMTLEEADELIRGLGDDAAEDCVFAARDAQLPPPSRLSGTASHIDATVGRRRRSLTRVECLRHGVIDRTIWPLFRSGSNWAKYRNPEFDKVVDAAHKSPNESFFVITPVDNSAVAERTDRRLACWQPAFRVSCAAVLD